MHGLQFADGDMSVNLRRFEAGMTQEGLQEPDIRPRFQHVRGAGVAQQVRCSLPVDSGEFHVVLDAGSDELRETCPP